MIDPIPSVAILMGTYNGGKYLAEQLDSFETQTHPAWKLWVSDDNSQDNTLDVLDIYKKKWGEEQVSIQVGPKQGFALNFFSLVNNKIIQEDYYAYSDQDDIWKDNKLDRAITWLKNIPEHVPALYCSRTCLVDDNKRELGFSPLFSRPPSFANALVQNIGGGNTMVFNNAARSLLQQLDISNGVVSHDWLTYQVVSGCGGEVFYDSNPTLKYRQHDTNIVGANNHWSARLNRVGMLYKGMFRDWNTCNIFVLNSVKHKLTVKNSMTLEQLFLVRSNNVLSRIFGLRKLIIYRQTVFGNLGLRIAIILKRF